MTAVYFDTLGCRLNEAEIQSWSRGVRQAGHSVVGHSDAAEIIILNSCAVTGEAVTKSYKRSRRLRRSNPQARIVLTGCAASLPASELRELDHVDAVISNQEKDGLVQRILEFCETLPDVSPFAVSTRGTHLPGERTRAFVKVQDGCNNRCTFCIVTKTRGNERSRPLEALVEEINALHRDGYQEAVLTGVHLAAYGREQGHSLSALVEALLGETSMPRIRLSSLEPWDLPSSMWSLWENPRLCPHVHVPLQSGSNRILRRMARRCTSDAYLSLITEARRSIPGLMITTDIIVGFPGEEEEDFANTMHVCEAARFSHIHIFPYSVRLGTAAASFPNHVGEQTKRTRVRWLTGLAKQLKKDLLSSCIGQRRPVLWEQAQELSDGRMVWSGLTDNYLRCRAVATCNASLANKIGWVQLEGIEDDALWGTPIRLEN